MVGRRLADTNQRALKESVAELLAPYRDAVAGSSIVVVPDVHYPFHPSTGLVTNPDVVAAVVDDLQSTAGGDVVVGCRSGSMLSTAASIRTLGYGRRDIEVVDLDEVDTARRPVELHDGSMEADVPRPLVEDTVVVVPSLRTDDDLGLALAMPTLGRAVLPDATTAEEIWSAVTLCSPAVTLVDASYTYLGTPRASKFLLSGADIVAVDAAVASVVGQTPSYLDGRAVRDLGATSAVDGFSLQEAAAELPTRQAGPAGQPGSLMRTGYRLYARLSGDAIPPQFLQ